MQHHHSTKQMDAPRRWYRGADVPKRVICRFANEVAKRFQPDKIILFGSHAYGTPHADSDVDILVVMPARNELGQAMRIRLSVEYHFPLDLLVRTPKNLAWRLADGDCFLKEIIAKGKVLYEKDNPRVGAKGRSRFSRRPKARASQPPMHDLVCFCCQPSAEKHLKAVLVELGQNVPRTHNLEDLLGLLLTDYPHLAALRRGLKFLLQFAVEARYPGFHATKA